MRGVYQSCVYNLGIVSVLYLRHISVFRRPGEGGGGEGRKEREGE